jgi:DegV family protein with EDD domain
VLWLQGKSCTEEGPRPANKTGFWYVVQWWLSMVKIVTDSTADIPADVAARLGITVVPCYVVFGIETYRDGVELTKEQFYEKLSGANMVPTTAAPPPAFYEEAYRSLASETDEIVSIHLAASLSAIYSSAAAAAAGTPGIRIEVLDSGQVTMGYGWMAVAASEAARRGDSLEQIVALVSGMKERSRVLAVLDTLEFVYRGGRVGWAGAFIGTLLRIKPIVEVRRGQINLLERGRSWKRSVDTLVELVRVLCPLERAVVLHANAPEQAEQVADRLQAIDPDWNRFICPAGVAIASHTGPGAVGIACVSSV